MIKKLNNFFFDLEEDETIGADGTLFYLATFGTTAIALMVKLAILF